ncbi:MAG: cytochrome P450 [Pleurocapsa sp. MO_226.B13]|nr:cytochrome P450 [Pleurocapsa sp. MO_226.B13]
MQATLPDGPKIPPLLQLIKWIAEPFEYFDDCGKRYGDIFTLRLFGFPPLVTIANPQGIQEIFSADARSFDVGRANEILRPFFGDNSLVLLDGDRHKREKKLLMPPFHGEKVKSYGSSICQIADQVASQWQVNEPFIARDAMQEISLELILQIVFGLSAGDRYQQIKPLLIELVQTIASPVRSTSIFFKFLQKDLGAWSPWGQFVRLKRKIYALLQAEIEDRRANPQLQSNDILSLMLSAVDEDGQPMTDEQLRDEMITLLGMGYEATATALAWAFYWIHKLPEVKQKLLQEIDSLGEKPDPMEIYRLPYLTAVCQETLRIYPVALTTFGRITNSTREIMGRQFEPDTMLIVSIYSTHHREDLYPNPKQFLPARFLERKYSSYEFLPFGGGNRLCLGYALAMLEMKLVLGTILSRYQLTLANNKPVKPKRRGLTVAPSNGIPLVMTGKRDRFWSVSLKNISITSEEVQSY